ncbi:hypothetical protein DEU56DRAFT_775615 [Suillus clintonianus]|uniref:uncharacterized protein n=1 Tax=Suillus clintonianus TaxID=1904413 RepID=UPI001B869BAD|nr:uncharacterized protein DEU56DRAFT_775615 [Suillus clintonianus]KAG2152723.1 hypothetical protein DEU56DRAFT_775615 [Suillus clintonianus]
MPYDFWWVSSTLLSSSCTYIFDRKLDSDLYAHVKASGRPQGTTHELLQNCIYPVPANSSNNATASGVSQSRAQPKTTHCASASCDPRFKDSFSSSVSSPPSSGTPVAQHDVQSAARQTWCNGSSDSANHLYAIVPQLPRTMRHATDQSPAALLHVHGESQYNVQHHHRRGNTSHGQQLPTNNFDASEPQIQCLWNDTQGQCGFTADTVTTVLKHISSHHLCEHQEHDSQVQCRCRGCLLRRTIRRDTILRHIREIHYGDKFRRKYLP